MHQNISARLVSVDYDTRHLRRVGLTERQVRKVEDVMAVPGDLLFQRLRRHQEKTAIVTITGDAGQRQEEG